MSERDDWQQTPEDELFETLESLEPDAGESVEKRSDEELEARNARVTIRFRDEAWTSPRFREIRARLLSAASSRVHEYPPEKIRQLLDDARWLLRAYELGFDPDLLAGAAASMTTGDLGEEIDPLPVGHLIAVSCTSYCNRYCVTRCKLTEQPSDGGPDS